MNEKSIHRYSSKMMEFFGYSLNFDLGVWVLPNDSEMLGILPREIRKQDVRIHRDLNLLALLMENMTMRYNVDFTVRSRKGKTGKFFCHVEVSHEDDDFLAEELMDTIEEAIFACCCTVMDRVKRGQLKIKEKPEQEFLREITPAEQVVIDMVNMKKNNFASYQPIVKDLIMDINAFLNIRSSWDIKRSLVEKATSARKLKEVMNPSLQDQIDFLGAIGTALLDWAKEIHEAQKQKS